MRALSERQRAIMAALQDGPKTMAELRTGPAADGINGHEATCLGKSLKGLMRGGLVHKPRYGVYALGRDQLCAKKIPVPSLCLQERLGRMRDPSASKEVAAVMPRRAYSKLPGINSSTLKQSTALEMLYALERSDDGLSYPLQFGSLVHKAVLEPHDFFASHTESWLRVISTAGLSTKEGQAARAECPNHIIANERMIEKAKLVHQAAYRHRQFTELMTDMEAVEKACQIWDESTRIWRKALLDAVGNGGRWIMDLKTISAGVSRYDIERQIYQFGYDLQGAMYTDIHEVTINREIDAFLFAWITGPTGPNDDVASEPFMLRISELPRVDPKGGPSIFTGWTALQKRLAILTRAIETNVWEAYEEERLEILQALSLGDAKPEPEAEPELEEI